MSADHTDNRNLPAPLVPADVDLRDFDYMPLYGNKLIGSETWALCDADEKVAALHLWWASWHQEPPGSLTDNDRVLAKAAGYGVAVKEFLRVKENAMRGWIKCSDGRLYHPVVASIAIEVLATKRRKKDENAADRERKRLKRLRVSGRPSGGQSDNSGRTADGIPPENALKGREGITNPSDWPNPPKAETPIDLKERMWTVGLAFLAKHGVPEARARPLLGKWRKLVGDVGVINALAKAEAECASEPIAFIEGCLRHANRKQAAAADPAEQQRERRAAILRGVAMADGKPAPQRQPSGDAGGSTAVDHRAGRAGDGPGELRGLLGPDGPAADLGTGLQPAGDGR